jgi:hypothetical protein
VIKKVSSKSYYYNSLVTFKNGKPDIELNNLKAIQDKKVNLVVIYDTDATWAEVFNTGKYTATGNVLFNNLLESYKLSIIEQFEINDENEGIVLEADVLLDTYIKAAQKISLIDYVLMVEIKEIPQDNLLEETADTE